MDVPLSQQQGPVTNSFLIQRLHEIFSRPDSNTRSLLIDSQSLLTLDGTVPQQFMDSVWYHAYQQHEHELVLVMPACDAALSPFVSALAGVPNLDSRALQALTVLLPFVQALTPENLHQPFHNGLSATLGLNSHGAIVSNRLALAAQPLSTLAPLLDLQPKDGYRSFDVFYYMLYSQKDRAELLNLKVHPMKYDLLRPSGTYQLPSWVVNADDQALAKDWHDAVKQCLPKDFRRTLVTTLSGILLLGNSDAEDRAEGAAMIGLGARTSSKYPPHELIAATYVALLQAVVTHLNQYLSSLDLQDHREDPAQDNVNEIAAFVTVAECPDTAKYDVLRQVFDNSYGINAEMVGHGIPMPRTPAEVSRALKKMSAQPPPPQLTVINDFSSLVDKSVTWARDTARDTSAPEDAANTFDLARLIPANRVWTILALAPSDSAVGVLEDSWSSIVVSGQIREMFVCEWAQKRGPVDYTTDFSVGDFIDHYRMILPSGTGGFRLDEWGASEGLGPDQFFCGRVRVYLSEALWQELENERFRAEGGVGPFSTFPEAIGMGPPSRGNYENPFGSQSIYDRRSLAPTFPGSQPQDPFAHEHGNHSYPASGARPSAGGIEREMYGPDGHIQQVPVYYDEDSDYDERDLLNNVEDEEKMGRRLEVQPLTRERRLWLGLVWLLTWWIPSPILTWFGGMKRSEVRTAWREKITIFFLIFLLNAAIIFYMIFLGRFICPDYDKVWNHKQLGTHQGTNDFYVGIHGGVYDITKFYKRQHSDNGIQTSESNMIQFAGQDISDYFPPPLTVACPSLVTDESVKLSYNTSLSAYSNAMHTSGSYYVPSTDTVLHNYTWYNDVFQPAIKKFYKGDIVQTPKEVAKIADEQGKYLITINKKIYDVSNYMITIDTYPSSESSLYDKYSFFPSQVESMFENFQGQDATEQWNTFDESVKRQSLECLDAVFYYGKHDFRNSAKCQAANVILLIIAAILTSITVVKFLASLRFGSKPLPSPQDRFVICQIPVYTESEDELRLALDSLTALDYDSQRKLLVVVCDGLITGAGNDRATPEIVLDIFGHQDRDSAIPRAYHAIAEGSKELNYAKVFSGIYENEGNTVPYLVVVKVGSPSEESRPGNRGKRDSQLIIMNFLNHVHFQGPMSPLELELFHQLNNVIGVEPERYDYLFTVDADTKVSPDSLTRMVAACTHDNKIAAVCGETSIENEQDSLSTMVQVYEYFISHHLTKAFESIFGSVTCLPGCFSLYRLRSAKRYKPLLISDEVIKEYSVRQVDTLHKKNLFSLGEDRYLTTLMSKFFPRLKLKFVADAKCKTQVPDEFKVLLSQRRRWINSTVHNLVELMRLDTMCGFFLCSMRGVVFVDLLGTLMLPSVVIYLGYLIYVIASHSSPLPIISIILIGVVYGLQALVYIFHRQWQHIFWMIIYILAYPLHSFILPIYSFWYMDDFSWGSTRVTLDESKGKKVLLQSEADIFDPSTVVYETWPSYASRMGYEGVERPIVFDSRHGRVVQSVFESLPATGTNEPQDQRAMSMYSRPYTTDFSESQVFDAGTAAQIRSTVKQVLAATDLQTMTSRQLREKVADLLGVEFAQDRAAAVDAIIDEELELLEDEDDGFDAPPIEDPAHPAEDPFQEAYSDTEKGR